METIAPIVVFTYKRLNTLEETINSLKKCHLSKESELYIFSDGFKNDNDKKGVLEVRNYIHKIDGFKKIIIFESEVNKGLANSIIDGVSLILKNHESVIVLEDDLISSTNYLLYMNECLHKYRYNKQVFSISGYSHSIKMPKNYPFDVFFFPRTGSWGWASWKDRWMLIDWDIKDFKEIEKNRKAFNYGGSDLFKMLKLQMNGEIDSWAIRWCYNQFKMQSYTAYPVITKTQNIGFGAEASNTNAYNRYFMPMEKEPKIKFTLPDIVSLDDNLIKQFRQSYSIRSRIIGKFFTYFHKMGLIKNK